MVTTGKKSPSTFCQKYMSLSKISRKQTFHMSKRSICFSIFEFLGRINPSVKKKKIKNKTQNIKSNWATSQHNIDSQPSMLWISNIHNVLAGNNTPKVL